MDARQIIKELESEIEKSKLDVVAEETGRVLSLKDGVVRMSGLAPAGALELLEIRTKKGPVLALALNIEAEEVGGVVLGEYRYVSEGDEVVPTGKILSVPVSRAFRGRVVNALGEPIDGKGPIKAEQRNPLEKLAPGVVVRESVKEPLSTGLTAIDAMIPIGRGQRELIIGDRQTGKTAIAIDAILNQKDGDVTCIYVAIGQKMSKVRRMVAEFEERGAMEHTVVVVAAASDPAPLWFLAPYAGCAIGEYFMEKGEDSLVIYDDLTKHAWAWRQVALLLERPPAREAYPGDIFYLHSRLLERAAKMSQEHGGGSLTALPIIETQAGDISAYIPTNVISITDGQIFLEGELFFQGIRPAISVGLSVSRVGSSAQTKAMKKVAGKLRLELAQFRELATFAQFAQDLDEATKKQIERGKRLTELLKQNVFEPLPLGKQIAMLYAGTEGLLDDVSVEDIGKWKKEFLEYLERQQSKLLGEIDEKKELDENLEGELKKAVENFRQLI